MRNISKEIKVNPVKFLGKRIKYCSNPAFKLTGIGEKDREKEYQLYGDDLHWNTEGTWYLLINRKRRIK